MNFEQIRSFVSVAKAGSYSAAAKERFISQPAISSQIKGLEEELGVTLFLRNLKKVTLSEQGREFYKYATRMLSLEKDMVRNFQEEKGNAYGLLDIGVPYLTIDELMDTFFVRALGEERGKATIRVMQKEDTDIPQMVLNGELDLGVSNHVYKHGRLAYEKAFVEEICLITPNTERYKGLDTEELKELLLTEGHIRYDFGEGCDFLWNDFFGKVIGEDLHNIKTIGTMSNYCLQLAAVEAGLGIGFISNICMQKYYRAGRIHAYRCVGLLEKPQYVVYDKERIEASEVLMETKEILLEELRKSIVNPIESF